MDVPPLPQVPPPPPQPESANSSLSWELINEQTLTSTSSGTLDKNGEM